MYTPDDPPVTSKISDIAFFTKQAVCPCRISHKSMRSDQPSSSTTRFTGKQQVPRSEQTPDLRDKMLNFVLSGPAAGSAQVPDLPKFQSFVKQQTSTSSVKSELAAVKPELDAVKSEAGVVCFVLFSQ